MSLLEVTMAVGILALLMTVSMQMLRAVGGQQRAAQQRALALQTVQALTEQIGNTPWNELTAEAANDITIPTAVRPFLPGAKLAITLSDVPEPVPAKLATVELTWTAPNGRSAGPARLTSWVYPDETVKP
jgi:hypothetical protein